MREQVRHQRTLGGYSGVGKGMKTTFLRCPADRSTLGERQPCMSPRQDTMANPKSRDPRGLFVWAAVRHQPAKQVADRRHVSQPIASTAPNTEGSAT